MFHDAGVSRQTAILSKTVTGKKVLMREVSFFQAHSTHFPRITETKLNFLPSKKKFINGGCDIVTKNIKYLCFIIPIKGLKRNTATYKEMHGSVLNNVTLKDFFFFFF